MVYVKLTLGVSTSGRLTLRLRAPHSFPAQNSLPSWLPEFLLVAPVLLFSMVAHEYAHGYAALKQGDETAYKLGRLTWNPLKHIDPFMTILLPLITFATTRVAFGGAKPVPVDPRNYRNLKRGDIIVSLAGIVTNVLLAILFIPLIIGLGVAGREAGMLRDSFALLQRMLLWGVVINLVLASFNLIPIPPLDGSHVMKYLLPRALAIPYQRVGGYGLLILMLLLTVGRRAIDIWMKPAMLLTGRVYEIVAPYVLPVSWMS